MLLFLGLIGIAISSIPESSRQSGKINVVASFYPLYFFSSEIGKEKADVITVTPAGVEPHDYELSPQDIVRIKESDILIINGGGFEPWAQDITANMNQNHTAVIEVSEGLMDRELFEDGEKITDPHTWLSPVLALRMADVIADAFIAADPAHKSYFESNRDTLKAALNNLDQEYRTGLGSCTGENIITSHEAFGYLAATYGFNQLAITGISPEAEPSLKELAALAQFAKKNNITHIFFESLVNPKLSETLAKEIGAETLVLNPLEGLTPDEISSGKNYITEMQSNLHNLKRALQCK